MTSLPRPNSLVDQPNKKTVHFDLAKLIDNDNSDCDGDPVSYEHDGDTRTDDGIQSEHGNVDLSPRHTPASVEDCADEINDKNSHVSFKKIADDKTGDVIIGTTNNNVEKGNEDVSETNEIKPKKMPFSHYEAQLEKAARSQFETIMKSYVNGEQPKTISKTRPSPIVNRTPAKATKRVTSVHEQKPTVKRADKLVKVNKIEEMFQSDVVESATPMDSKDTIYEVSENAGIQSADCLVDQSKLGENDTRMIGEINVDEGSTLDENQNVGDCDNLSTLCERQSIADVAVVDELPEDSTPDMSRSNIEPRVIDTENRVPTTTNQFKATPFERKRFALYREIRTKKVPAGRVLECTVATVKEYDVDGEYRYMLGKALDTYTKYHRQEKSSAKALTLESAIKGLHESKRNAFPSRPLTPRVSRIRVRSAPPLAILPQRANVSIVSPKLPEPAVLPGEIIKKVGLANGLLLDIQRERPTSAFPLRTNMDKKLHNKLFTPRPTMFESAASSSKKTEPTDKKQQQQQKIRKGLTDAHFARAPVPADAKSDYRYRGGFFSANSSPKKGYFTIHPEWVSENFSVQKLSLNNSSKPVNKYATYPLRRRCRSAPPPSRRNPITWQ